MPKRTNQPVNAADITVYSYACACRNAECDLLYQKVYLPLGASAWAVVKNAGGEDDLVKSLVYGTILKKG